MIIDTEKCTGCGGCVNLCPVQAIDIISDTALIAADRCSHCGLCATICGAAAPKSSRGDGHENI